MYSRHLDLPGFSGETKDGRYIEVHVGGLYPPTVTKPTKTPWGCARRQNLKKRAAHGGRVKSYKVHSICLHVAEWY